MRSFNPRIFSLSSSENSQPHLIGSRCSSCGASFFPQQLLCTECFEEGTLAVCSLSTKGAVYSYTIVERESLAPKGFEVPYAYGYVDLPEGVRVISKIIGWTPDTLKLGVPVKLVMETVRTEPSEGDVMGFRFCIC